MTIQTKSDIELAVNKAYVSTTKPSFSFIESGHISSVMPDTRLTI